MAAYQELVEKYRARQKDTVIDTIAATLTYVDEVAVDAGILEQTGLLTDLTGGALSVLPFVLIAITENHKVLLGRKTRKSGTRDAAFRMAKTGAAMGIGAGVTAMAGFLPAIPATMGVRFLFDKCHSKLMLSRRVQVRTARLRELRELAAAPEQRGMVDANPPGLCSGAAKEALVSVE